MNLSQISVIVYPIATSDSIWSSALAVLGAATQRGGCGGAAAARRPRRLLAVAMDGEAAAEEEEEIGRERASAVGAGEGRGAQQRRTLWFVVIAGVFNLY